MNGKRFGGSLSSENWDAAEQQLIAIGRNGKIVGELVERIPAYPGVGTYVKLTVWFKNLLTRFF